MACSDDDAIALLGLIFALKRKERSKWSKDWLKKRNIYSHVNLLNELKVEPKDWHNYLRIDEESYLRLLSLVRPLIEKKDTVMRRAISAHERLTITLRFLATGRSYEDLKFSAIISPQAIGKIVPETCEAIFKVLQKDYMKFPRTEDDWRHIAKDFEMRWNFPHCIGALDGKHVEIVPPDDCGSEFYNYKKRHSMVMMALVDGNYQFIMCDFGTNGRVSDGGVLKNTMFFKKLEEKQLCIPPSEIMPKSKRKLPYVFVADDAFPLRKDMMKRFRQINLISKARKIYNYRVSRARRIVENAFGILASRFRIYHTQINLEPPNIVSVVMATIALHNYLMTTTQNYATKDCFDQENANGSITLGLRADNSNMLTLQRTNKGNSPRDAKQIRIQYMKYFKKEGKVSWQENYIS